MISKTAPSSTTCDGSDQETQQSIIIYTYMHTYIHRCIHRYLVEQVLVTNLLDDGEHLVGGVLIVRHQVTFFKIVKSGQVRLGQVRSSFNGVDAP